MLLDEIRTFLLASDVTPVYLANLPPTPADVVALYEYAGLAPEYVLDDPLMSVERPRFQIVARSASHATARLTLERAYRALGRVANQTIGGTWYRRIRPLTSGPTELEPDNSRTVLAWNFEAEKGLSAL